ncbi:PAS domain-containing protein [Rapidithrix thailandica]|uniref:histidine kinase n=1 Tax=Rapidithrix thailandica TaxID=413964 RepID=A0AAW9S1J6_9BACT
MKVSLNENEIKQLLNTLCEVVFQLDTWGRWQFVNPAWEKVTGFPVESMIGKMFVDALYVDDVIGGHRFLDNLFKGKKESGHKRLRLRTQWNKPVWVEIRASKLEQEPGVISGLITEIKNTQTQEIDELELLLQQIEEDNQVVYETQTLENTLVDKNTARTAEVRKGVFDWKVNENRFYFSPQWKKMLGYAPEELIDREVIWKTLLHPEERKQVLHKYIQRIDRVFDNELRLLHKNGNYLYVRSKVYSVLDEEGKVQRIVGLHEDVTQTRKLEQRLNECEQRYKYLSDLMEEGVFIHERGLVLHANQALLEMLGCREGELLGENLILKFVPDTWQSLVYEAVHKGWEGPYEIELRRKDNTLFPAEIRAKQVYYAGEQVRVVAIRDLSLQKAEKAKRQERENTIKQIQVGVAAKVGDKFFESMVSQLATLLQADHVYVGRIIGETKDQIKTISYYRDQHFTENFEYSIVDTPCGDALCQGFCFYSNGVDKVYPEDELLKSFKIKAYIGTSLFDSNNQPIGILVAMFTKPIDHRTEAEAEALFQIFSSRAGAELERKLTEQLVRTSEEKFRNLVENISGVFWIKNITHNCIEYISPQFDHVWDFDRNKLYEDIRYFSKFIHPDDRERVRKEYHIASFGCKTFSTEYRIIGGKNKEKTVWAKSTFYYSRAEHILREFGYAEDITQRKVYEEAIKDHNVQLEKANQELDNFVYSVSHDLRAPLTSAIGLITLAKEEPDHEQIKEYLLYQEKCLGKLDNFIQDILNYSRNSRMKLVPERITFPVLVNEVFEQLKYSNEGQQIRKEIAIQPLEEFYSDYRRLFIILNNLISNAIRFSNPYAKEPYVKITVKGTNEYVWMEIEDNGQGIAERHLQKIFEMFYRASENKPGSGLGLYIVKETVGKLKGKVGVTSRLGEFTRFTIGLPNLK